jgi:hypothetical protein
VRAPHPAGADQFANRILDGELARHIQARRPTLLPAMANLQEMAPAHLVADVAHENDGVAARLEKLRCDVRLILDQPDHRDRRRRIDYARRALII